MISARTISIFIIACGALCLTIAIERYYSAVTTAKAIADQIEGFEFESVELPTESVVCGIAGIMLLVAGLKLLFDSRHGNKVLSTDDGLLK